MSLKRFGILILAALGSAAVQAQAQADKIFSLTISPVHLILPIVEFTGEYALSRDFGIAAIGGYGSIQVKNSASKDIKLPVLELGAQAAYYALGSFRHGMQVGGELLWIKVSPPKDEGVTVAANGVAVGPFLGYKFISSFGLTVFVQGGYEFLFAQAKATDATGKEIEASADGGLPLLNINLGWSF